MPIYMKYDAIKGSGKGKYAGWIPLKRCDLGGQPGRIRNIRDIAVWKEPDASSPRLMELSLERKLVDARIDFVEKKGTVPFLSVELEQTLIVSFSVSGIMGTTSLVEQLELNFEKMRFTHEPTGAAKGRNAAKIKMRANWKVTPGKK